MLDADSLVDEADCIVSNKLPTTALELRGYCAGWPEDVVRRAVKAAFEEVRPPATKVLPPQVTLVVKKPDRRQPVPDDTRMFALAAFVAAWLTEPDVPRAMLDDPPRLSQDLVEAVWRHLQKGSD